MNLLTGIKHLIPNLLSIFRLTLAVLFPFSQPGLWVWMIIGAGASDFLDGLLARWLKVTSISGALLDGIADKAFMFTALGTLVVAGIFSPWWLPLIILRDLVIIVLAIYAASTSSWYLFRQIGVKWSGKLATAGQFLLLILAASYPETISAALAVAILFSLIAAVDYSRLFVQTLQKRRDHAAP